MGQEQEPNSDIPKVARMTTSISFWITLSNYLEDSLERFQRNVWWYQPNRDNVQEGDKVIIYQPGFTQVAENRRVVIHDDIKLRYIGYFTAGLPLAHGDTRLPASWWDDRSGWIKISDASFIPDNEAVLRTDVNDELLLQIANAPNMGRVFQNRTWIRITQVYYDLTRSLM